GGFGLMAAGNIPKPTLWTFAFFSRLKGRCAHRDAHSVVMEREDGSWEGVVWNEGRENKSFRCTVALPGDAAMALTEEMVEDGGSDPLKIWHDLGEPAVISKETEALLRQSGAPRVSSRRIGGAYGPCTLEIRGSGVCFFRARPLKEEADPGYDYSYYVSQN
ncbi:MAG: xylan 1,4-beta-xylosidase, partial [Clostridia bacterium]|nr:xylan 1,4-beta-xylosidase [Clostridia bacterium]